MNDAHIKNISQVLTELQTTDNGLSSSSAKSRIEKSGPNALKEQNKAGVFKLFISQFKDFMVLLLIAAAVISAVMAYVSKDTHELFDTVIIVFIIFLNATVGFIQQYRADKAIEQLKKLSVCQVKTKRDGKIISVDSQDLVAGDVIILEEGDMVPADCRLLKDNNLKCDESALTGESTAVSKSSKATPSKNAGLGDRKNMLFSSTFVVQGNAEAVVVSTGMNTEIGKIADMLDSASEMQTPLQKNLDALGKVISYGVIAIAVIIFAFGVFFKHNPLIENFMSSVAIAVAAIPEGLPAVVTIIMAMGMQKMSKSKAIVRKLHAVETLGSCNFICSDKTGTLTENKMKVISVYCGGIEENETFAVKNIASEKTLMFNCMEHCSTVKGEYKKFLGDPTEIALKNFIAENSAKTAKGQKTAELPFESNRKLMSVCILQDDGKFVYTKGAPDVLMDRCAYIMIDGKTVPFSQEQKAKITKQNVKMASKALRVLGFAYKPFDGMTEDNLVFLGLAGMIDPPRKEVLQAVRQCKKAGITPVMITGDHKDTAFAIAQQLEIAKSFDQVITGEQLDGMSESDLQKAVANARVYARVSPKHKMLIVNALQKNNNVVAMTGDGINDAPSIKKADIGIAMGISGTDVTKNASDMIISDDNFATIVLAVKEGRRIFANIKKTIQFFLSTNLAEVLSIFIVSVLFCRFNFLLSAQLLWINLVTDSFPVLALGMEKAEPDVMERKPEKAEKSMFNKQSLSSIGIFGAIMTVITLTVFFVSLNLFGNEVATTMTFFTLSFLELFHAFNIRSDRQSIFKIGLLSNKVLLFTVLGGILANVAICVIPFLQTALGVVDLTVGQWIAVFLSSLAIVPVGEVYKAVIRSKNKKAKLIEQKV